MPSLISTVCACTAIPIDMFLAKPKIYEIKTMIIILFSLSSFFSSLKETFSSDLFSYFSLFLKTINIPKISARAHIIPEVI